MKNVLTFAFLICVTQLFSQDHPTCDGQRYRNEVFTETEMTTGIKYGENTTIFDNFQELYLDIFQPVGDEAEARPVVLLAFGGSFVGGEREALHFLCNAYAKKGFVAVTIDYRLYDGDLFPLPTPENMQDVVVKSIGDMKAAIRFLKEDAATDNEYRIDPDLIFVGGVSAGGITAMHTAVLDSTDVIPENLRLIVEENGGFEGNSSSNYEYSSDVAGVINFSGGLNDASWIDAEDPPFVSIHDEFDGTVPYSTGFASIFGFDIIYLEGSERCHFTADSVSVLNSLKTIEGSSGHVSYFNSDANTALNVKHTTDFLFEIICPSIMVNAEDHHLENIHIYPNPASGQLFIDYASDQIVLNLYSSLGQKVGNWSNAHRIDISQYNTGRYFLKITDMDNGQSLTHSIIIE